MALMIQLLTGEDSAREDRPNIVFIFADDLGYGDLSCYGATLISTPNIDRLAAQGIKCTDAHAAASVCSPSRYGILTGRSPWRLGLKGNGYRLEPNRLNLASMLRSRGYRTAAIGKWHLGYSKDWNQLPITGPLERGFDYHFGVPQNHNDSTRVFIENHDIVGRKLDEPYNIIKGRQFPEGVAKPRIEDLVDSTLTRKAIQFIERNKANPFFLYFTPCAPHTHITPVEKFRGTSKAGLLGDYIQELDFHVGEILKTLEHHSLTSKTLVIFTSDNGGSPKDFKGTHGTILNLASTSGGILDKYKTAKVDARKMGHITNGPWQDGKGYPEEGGHRVPFIAKWPGKIKPGSTSDLTFSLTDIMATTADILGLKLPDNAAEDSFSVLPMLVGDASFKPERPAVFIQGDTKNNAIAICSGRWKVIDKKDPSGNDISQLFDLLNDLGESNDLSSQFPNILSHLQSALVNARTSGRTRPISRKSQPAD